jgi:PmbA protein
MTVHEPVREPVNERPGGAADREMDELVAAYLAECRRRGVRAEVRAMTERREEFVARNGRTESEGVTADAVLGLTVGDGARRAMIATGTGGDVATVVAEGLALLDRAGGRRGSAPPPGGPPRFRALPGRTTESLTERHDALRERSVIPEARECEVRALQVRRTLHHATPEQAFRVPTAHASIVLRATVTGADGGTVHVDRAESGPGLGFLLRRFDEHMLPDARSQLRAPERAAGEPLPDRVVLAAGVAAQLVCLLAESLSAEAVEQGGSRLTGRLGERVGAARITVVDDPVRPDGPRHLPFDDEGTAAEAHTLIDAGVLRGFLGSRAYAHVSGAAPGSARQPEPTAPPRPGAANLCIVPGTMPAADGPVLRITQTHGMHLANGITGEFSTGATGVVHDGEKTWRISGLSVSGNVLDLLHNVAGVGALPSWSDDGESSFGSPDLWVTGLALGR